MFKRLKTLLFALAFLLWVATAEAKILLTGTSDLVQVITGSAVTTIYVHASWADMTTTALTPGRTNTQITTAATTTVVGSPAASTQRQVKFLAIRNSHASSSNAITVQHTDGTTIAEILKYTLLAGETLEYTDDDGFRVIDASGQIKSVVTANAGTNLDTSALLTTSAHDAAFGTAGSADAQVRSIQGIASMTPVQVSQATASNLNATVVGTGTFATQAAQSGTWTVQPGNTANTTAWKVDGSAVTQPVSGTVTANATLAAETTKVIGTARVIGNGGATLDSTVGAGTAPTNQVVTGAIYNSTEISPTTGQAFAIQADSKGRTRSVLMDAAGNTRGVNVTAGNAGQADITSVAGTAVTANTGNAGAGTQRVVLASDQPAVTVRGGNSNAIISCTANAALNMTTATTTQIVAASGSTVIYVCSFSVLTSAATNVKFVRGTGTNCGTGTTDVSSNMHFTPAVASTTSGIARGSGQGAILFGAASGALCVTSSAAVNVDVDISYAQF